MIQVTYQIVDTEGQSVAMCIPTQTVLILLNIRVAIHLGTQPAWLSRPSPAGSRHHVFANLPNQKLVSSGTGNE